MHEACRTKLAGKALSAALALELCLLLLTAFAPAAVACAAYPYPITLEGGEQMLLHGDERFSYATDMQGRILCNDRLGRLCYVRESNGAYVAGEPYGDVGMRSASPLSGTYVTADSPDMRDRLEKLRAAAGAPSQHQRGLAPSPLPYPYDYDNDPLKGHIESARAVNEPDIRPDTPLVILMVEFSDIRHQLSDTQWHDRIFGKVSPYYQHVSNGAFTYIPANERYGIANDGVIKVRLPIDMPHYVGTGTGQNAVSGARTGLYAGDDGRNYAIFNDSSLFAYALEAASGMIDYADYDYNQDGYVSPTELGFLVVVAGYDASLIGVNEALIKGTAVWPHCWVINPIASQVPSSRRVTQCVNIGGVKMYKYTMIAENWNKDFDYANPSPSSPVKQAEHGTACHELGHSIGLPDLYATDGMYHEQSVSGMSLMASGSWGAHGLEEPGSSPTLLDPYCRWQLGFQSPQTVTAPGEYAVVEAADAGGYNILFVGTSDPSIVYLIENRQIKGMDRGLDRYYVTREASGGLVVWRIDLNAIAKYSYRNEVNNHEGEYGVMPVFVKDSYFSNPFRSSLSYAFEPGLALPLTVPRAILDSYDANAHTMYARFRLVPPAPSPPPAPDPPPATGDNAAPTLWLALCAAAALGAAFALAGFRRRDGSAG